MDGMPANGNTNNWKKVSMRSETWQAVTLLREAARPERHHLIKGVAWLVLAAALEMIGPFLGKALIDNHLLPHRLDWPSMIALIVGSLLSGCAASVLRYLQLLRLAGLACASKSMATSCACPWPSSIRPSRANWSPA